MADATGPLTRKGSAAELLGNWRAAERDVIAAQETADVATLAAAAAEEAVIAATETGDAARLSMQAAQRAERSATRTATTATLTARAALGGKHDADLALEGSIDAETEAGVRFREAQALDFQPG